MSADIAWLDGTSAIEGCIHKQGKKLSISGVIAAVLRGGKRRTVRRPPRRPSASSSTTSNVQGVKNANGKAKSAAKVGCP